MRAWFQHWLLGISFIYNVLGRRGYVINVYSGMIFSVWTGSAALRFTAAGAPLVARRIRILPMNKHA
jgi:hypothetical protein